MGPLVTAYTLGLIGAAVTLLVVFEMLRRRMLREKYAVFWVFLAVLIAVVAVFPGLLAAAAELTGVQVPANLLFFVASLVLLAVNVQLSTEICRLEDRTRALAEELAMVRLRQDQAERSAAGRR
jgi:hypothetical protein